MQGEVGFTSRNRLIAGGSAVVAGGRTASIVRIEVHVCPSRMLLRRLRKISCFHLPALLRFHLPPTKEHHPRQKPQ